MYVMYLCMHVWLFLCVYVCMYVCMYVCLYAMMCVCNSRVVYIGPIHLHSFC